MAAEVKVEPETQKLQEKLIELQREMEEKAKLAEERLNQLKYLQADFENYRKSLDREREQIIELANEGLIKDLLVVLDDFERALGSMKEGKDKEGLRMLYKNFFKILEQRGLRPIEALGKKFDPYYHEAVLREKSDQEEGTVLEELQKGYMLKSKVIRHSKVKVAVKSGEG
ncbi:MAG: nucleotide exchange factor GrpE [Candidatus Hadarchaeum sp.]|uniref:nucleotide exchange factor GrpE n=1 Tax=Candidatus Hadarchaeum sp. TaxID=2883567 RepID=UPI003D0F8909